VLLKPRDLKLEDRTEPAAYADWSVRSARSCFATLSAFVAAWLWTGWQSRLFADGAFLAVQQTDYSGLGAARADFFIGWAAMPVVGLAAFLAVYFFFVAGEALHSYLSRRA
jgi:hypothetical protein